MLSQTEKDRHYQFHSYVEYIKKKKNEQTKPDKNKHIDTEHRVLVTREEGGAGKRAKWVNGINCLVMKGY